MTWFTPRTRQLREAAPLHQSEFGSWMLARFEDASAALRDPRFGKGYARQVESRFGPDWRVHPSLTASGRSMVNIDGPEHTRLPKFVVKGLRAGVSRRCARSWTAPSRRCSTPMKRPAAVTCSRPWRSRCR